ncbi:MAG: ferrous iron transport protein B [Vampirovibrionia bacterium]
MNNSTFNNNSTHPDKEKTKKGEVTSLPNYVLVGNPNVGKSVIFGALTGLYVEVSNYPGTTVDISTANTKYAHIIDTPGVYGIGDFNEEETVTRDIVLKHNNIINIVNAVSLERDLFLTQQLIDMGFSIIVVLNQIDEAEARGIKIDINKLKQSLGVEVFPVIATKKVGIETLKENFHSIKKGKTIPEIEKLKEPLKNSTLTEAEMLLAIEGDSFILEKFSNISITPDKENIYNTRRDYINNLIEQCVSETDRGINLSTKIGRWLLNPVIGILTAMFVLFALYQIIGVFVAGTIVGFTENLITNSYVPWMEGIVKSLIKTDWLVEILAGEFGLLTMTVQYIVGVLLPLVIGFFIFFAILEDSGYMPRLAVLCDKFLSYLGLNGKAVIPLILGFGCVTMAVISSRILTSSRERIIAIAILALTIPCSAQVAIIIALLAATATPWAWAVYLITLLSVMLTVSFLLNKFLPGKSPGLILDLPPMRIPDAKNVLSKAMQKAWHFLLEATPLFALGTLILGVLNVTGGLEKVHELMTPLVVNFLDLPKDVSNVFIMGLIRRDFGATGLASMAGLGSTASILSPIQIVVSLIVITLFVPCIATIMVIFKERGLFETILLWVFSMVIAFLTGGLVSFILNLVM